MAAKPGSGARRSSGFKVERLLLVVVIAIGAIVVFTNMASTPTPGRAWQRSGYVAHALGVTPEGHANTNTLEAFRHSYAMGHRVFEIDFLLLGDGTPFAAHDAAEHRYGFGKNTKFTDLEWADVKGRKFEGRLTPLNGRQVVELLATHRDMTLIVDTKQSHIEVLRALLSYANDDSVRDRLVPHVFAQWQLDALRRLYHFPDYMVAMYRMRMNGKGVLDFVERNRLDSVMMKPYRYSEGFHRALNKAGARYVYVHSLTDPQEILRFRHLGLGVYSNGWIER